MAGIALIILASMVFIVGDISFFSPMYRLQVTFHHVDGLLVGSKVAMSGVKVGKVEKLEVIAGVVHLGIKVENQIKIPRYAKFTIDTMGLMGEKLVGIIVPTEKTEDGYFAEGDVIEGIDPMRMMELMSEGHTILRRLKMTVTSINDIVGDPYFAKSVKNSAFSIEETMANLRLTSRNMEGRLDEIQGKVERFLDHLDNVGFQTSELMDDARLSILDSLDNINAVSKDIHKVTGDNRQVVDKALKDFGELASHLKKLIKEIENEGVTASDVRKTMNEVRRSSENVRFSTDEIRKIFDDGSVRENIKDSTFRLKDVLERTDGLLSGMGGMDSSMGWMLSYNTEQKIVRNDVDVQLNLLGKKLRMGVRNIGHGSELDFQVGFGPIFTDKIHGRFGVIKSKPGLGFDYSYMKGMLTMVDVVDTHKTYVDSTTLYDLNHNVQLMSRTENILSSDREFNLGVRYHF
jgi:phospholipid/cholesterol/gamma-HCH transport system substrate-binding protein